MKVSKKPGVLLTGIAATLMLGACGGGYKVKYYPVTGRYFEGVQAKSVYKAFLGSSIGTLNYLSDQEAKNSRHIANFIDSLVMNDEYTVLRRQLAQKVTKNDSDTVFTFDIKPGIKWYTYRGDAYKVAGKEQEVVADDFVKSAEVILNFNNSSKLAYLLEIFLDGAYEYYCYTMMGYLMNQMSAAQASYPASGKTKEGGKAYTIEDLQAGTVTPECKFNYKTLKNQSNELIALQLTNLVSYESKVDVSEINIQADQLADIAAFKRVGVKVGTNAHQLVYTLSSSMPFFPTALTYCPFLPVNRAFYDQQKANFGKKLDNILYCGPYLLTKYQGSEIVYTKNENYYDADKVHIERIEYKVLEDQIADSYTREEFENGRVDGFGLTPADKTGWEKYMTNGDPEHYGYENPYSPYVNARELDEIDSVYAFNVNVNRDPNTYNKDRKNSVVTKEEIMNANRALRIKEVRAMIIDGLALTKYGNVFVDKMGTTSPDQYAINTFIPKGFARDENDRDYVDYYFEAVAGHEGITKDEAEAKWKQQQYAGLEIPDTEEGYQYFKSTYVDSALEAIEKYNAACDAGTLLNDEGEPLTAADKITYPVKLEAYGSSSTQADYKEYEDALYQDLNEKMNGERLDPDIPYTNVDLPKAPAGGYSHFNIVMNTAITQQGAEALAASAGYTLGVVYGWGPDYADPLTYLHCYVDNGDMNTFTGHNADTQSYYLDGGEIAQENISRVYTEMVNEAARQTEDTATRYELFAEAEYYCHTEMYLWRPVHMNTQGWTASVSRAAGYENPNAPYGLAGYKMTGMWVLKDVPQGSARAEARRIQQELKDEAIKGGYIQIYD